LSGQKKYTAENKEKIKLYRKNYYSENKEYLKEKSKINRENPN
jgi:hypothetical protein